jgi:hypothetical protein
MPALRLPARRLPAAALTLCVSTSALAACASSVAGNGTGAGPRNGVLTSPAASTSAGSASKAPSSATSSKPSSSAASSSTSANTHPVPSAPLRTVTARGSNGTTYVVKIWAENSTTDCAAHAYGAVVNFLKHHPCYGLRQVLATTTVDGKEVGFAQRSIGFRGGERSSYRAAGQFRELVTRSGTGNVNDLMREGYRLPSGPTSVPFPNAFSALGQDNGVTVVEAWYVHGPTPDNDPPLVRMAQDIFLQV